MEFKGTKGEWINNVFNIQVNPNEPIKTSTVCRVYGNDEESIANAKLISAAPELLESLKDLIEWANIKDGSPSQYLRDKALSAIKKATK